MNTQILEKSSGVRLLHLDSSHTRVTGFSDADLASSLIDRQSK